MALYISKYQVLVLVSVSIFLIIVGSQVQLVDGRKVMVASPQGVEGQILTGRTGQKRSVVELETRKLRAVPSGPDPLHHNGGSPKKPRNSP